MEKKIIYKEIFTKDYDGDCADVRFGDLPKDLNDDDVINIGREQSFFSENNSYDAYTTLLVTRPTLETDEEFNERKRDNEKFKEQSRKRRYSTYLELKKEFENGK